MKDIQLPIHYLVLCCSRNERNDAKFIIEFISCDLYWLSFIVLFSNKDIRCQVKRCQDVKSMLESFLYDPLRT